MTGISRFTVLRKRALAWLGAGLLIACGLDRVTSSEIGNPPKRGTVMGVIYSENGQPAPGTLVGLMPTRYDPVRDPGTLIRFDTTDAQGAYLIDSVDSGSYNIQAVRFAGRTRLLIRDLEVRSDTIVTYGRQILRKPGTISVLIPDSVPAKNAYVYMPGTHVYASTASLKGESRLIYLDSVPSGISPEIVYHSSLADSGPLGRRIRISDGVRVVSGDTIPASAFQAWSNTSRIFLNTTASGANVTTAGIHGFPLVVRLGPGASVFSSSAADGRDLRFAKPDGTPLAHEIESWDGAAAQAIIWVKLDTVRANDSSQFIRMYWGNPSAPAPAIVPVFDSASGFRSVWHMDAVIGGKPPKLKDASSRADTILADSTADAPALGASPLGKGLDLDGTVIQMHTGKSTPGLQTLTVSIWFKTTSDSGGKLIGFGGNAALKDTARDRHLWLDTTGKVHFGVFDPSKPAREVLSNAQALNDGQWHLAAGQLSPAGMALYVDGVKVASNPETTEAQVYSGFWKLGFDFLFYDWPFAPTALYFKGMLDEATVATKARSAEWLKLSYESQRPDSRLLRFDKP